MEVVWTKRAVRDLAHVREYVGARNRSAAGRVAGRILAVAALLRDHPGIGRAGRVSDTRELVVTDTPFLLAYRVRRDRVEVLRVLHSSREWPNRMR